MIGTQFANYLIQEKLGEGGMGVVYKGVDLNLDRAVAIKLLPSDLADDPQLIQRFRAEAKALAHLNHVNIATVYNYLHANGQYLMVMEYVEGETFQAIVERRRRIGCNEAIRLTKQALLGLGFAHRQSIIHRDIKPSNLMLTRDGVVKVMDFGIAKVLGQEEMTRTSGLLGTLAYMSPEQIRSQALDARSDIYSVSVTLYEMLTGHLPFNGRSEFELMSAHLHTPPPRLNRYCPEISSAVESALFKGLEKNPAARYRNAEEFGAALEHALARPEQVVRSPKQQAPPVSPPASPGPVASRRAASPQPKAAPLLPPTLTQPRRAAEAKPLVQGQHRTSRRTRSRLYSFLSLAFGVAVLFCLFFGGLYQESVPMLLACLVLLYFLPILIAAVLLKRNGATVVKLNALRGWTGVGWIQAMKEALAEDD